MVWKFGLNIHMYSMYAIFIGCTSNYTLLQQHHWDEEPAQRCLPEAARDQTGLHVTLCEGGVLRTPVPAGGQCRLVCSVLAGIVAVVATQRTERAGEGWERGVVGSTGYVLEPVNHQRRQATKP